MSTVKISALNPLVSGSTCAAAVLPIVNDGVTEKISIDNLRGTLRGASNQGPANAALNGGINNAACRLGDSALGGQNNIVNANMVAQTAANGSYGYCGPLTVASGSLNSVIGGLKSEIKVASATISAGYPLSTNAIISSVGSCITGSATAAYEGYYPIVGGDMVIGGNGNTIVGPTANGNYANGLNIIMGGYSNKVDMQLTNLDGSAAGYSNMLLNTRQTTISRDYAPGNAWMSHNNVIGGYSQCIARKGCATSFGSFNNNIFGGSHNCLFDVSLATTLNTSFSCIIGVGNLNSIISANRSVISGSNVNKESVILGGCCNQILDVNRAVVLGGSNVTASVADAAHVNQLVFKTGAQGIPTSDPGVAGQVWNDAGTLKIS